MRTFAKLKQFFQTDKPESGSRKPESAGYGVPTFLSDVYNRCTQAKKQPADCCLSRRSLRPKKRQDVPMFLSAVYNRCTQAKKQPADCCLSGRSMVEMLGVLAIIGVLSVGAMAGYSKAMNKYRMNKSIAIINQVWHNILEISGKNVDVYWRDDLYTYGIISEDICPSTYGGIYGDKCPLPIGEFRLYVTSNAAPSNITAFGLMGSLMVSFTGSDQIDKCINFLSHHWEKNLPLEWWGRQGHIEVSGDSNYILWSHLETLAPFGAKKKIDLNDITTACNKSCKRESCEISFEWLN